MRHAHVYGLPDIRLRIYIGNAFKFGLHMKQVGYQGLRLRLFLHPSKASAEIDYIIKTEKSGTL